jgi:hypothetical protein
MKTRRSPLLFTGCLLITALATISGWAAESDALVLLKKRFRLGVAGSPEWESFKSDPPDAQRLDLKFESVANTNEATLLIRQDEVRQDWFVELNGKRVGKLFLMEADLWHTLAIPAAALRNGENVLSIVPPSPVDDIVIHEIRVIPRPLQETVGLARLGAVITDEATGERVPCRLTVVDQNGSLAALVPPSGVEFQAVRPGVIYTGTGRASAALSSGKYTVYASRGFEWSVGQQVVELKEGETEAVELKLRREVSTPGLVASDTHIHTLTHSGHGDCSVEERMLTLAGEEIELPISTDHNVCIDFAKPARAMGVERYLTPITGSEITTNAGHFNIFPIQPETAVPYYRLTEWSRLMTAMRGSPGVRVVVLNHPRNVHNNFQPFAAAHFDSVTGENKRGPEFTFDAMELLNSSAQQSDYMRVFRDWFALLNYGYRITAVGSSDSHDVSRYIVGQGRTYIACPDADPARLNVETACSNLLAGRALVSMGLLVQMKVDERFTVGDLASPVSDSVQVHVDVLGPSWTTAANVTLFANGEVIAERFIEPTAGSAAGLKASIDWSIHPAHDVHLVAMATGPDMTAPYWAIPKPYQPTSPTWAGRVIAATNPIWLDADHDSKFTAARAYAQKLIDEHGTDPATLVPALGRFDQAVAIQAASLCANSGVRLGSDEFTKALESATPAVRQGFARYSAPRQ